MMHLLLVLVLAQSVTASVDLSAFDWGVLTRPESIDVDGNPHTQEWLVGKLFTSDRRVVAVRVDGSLCAGPWFTVSLDWTLDTVAGRSVLTRLRWPFFDVLHLEMPSCP